MTTSSCLAPLSSAADRAAQARSSQWGGPFFGATSNEVLQICGASSLPHLYETHDLGRPEFAVQCAHPANQVIYAQMSQEWGAAYALFGQFYCTAHLRRRRRFK